jgi:uncharacterized repeat protein (TIGR03803 family)
LHTFEEGVEGMSPRGEPVLHSDGLLYGTTTVWSPYQACGSVFVMATDGALGVHHVFSAGGVEDDDGCDPRGALLSATDGAIYGTTIAGGAFGWGTIFRLRKVTDYPDH